MVLNLKNHRVIGMQNLPVLFHSVIGLWLQSIFDINLFTLTVIFQQAIGQVPGWIAGDASYEIKTFLCRVSITLLLFANLLANWSIALVSLDRFMAVTRPINYHVKGKAPVGIRCIK